MQPRGAGLSANLRIPHTDWPLPQFRVQCGEHCGDVTMGTPGRPIAFWRGLFPLPPTSRSGL
eukprot:5907235-Alexandrium_andersonii.AAC.1